MSDLHELYCMIFLGVFKVFFIKLRLQFKKKRETLAMLYTVHTDGWSRGNPGPSGCAFVVSQWSKVIETGKFFLGTTTNNQAEYMGAILGLTAVQKLWGTEVHLVMDSELVIKQLQWIYKVKGRRTQNTQSKSKKHHSRFQKSDFYFCAAREK
jgi:ribonuclease HI